MRSESRSLSSQLATCQDKHQQSQAALQESESQLSAAKARLRTAEDTAATQLSLNKQLQQKLSADEDSLAGATAKLQQVTAAQQALAEALKREREACGEEHAAHAQAAAQV